MTRTARGATVFGVIGEALASLRGRGMRTGMTAAGIALGVAATVATVGLSSTSAGAVGERFDAAEATTVTAAFLPRSLEDHILPDTSDADRVRSIIGVVDAGIACSSTSERTVARTRDGLYPREAPVVAMEPATVDAYGIDFVIGRSYDAGHAARGDAVAVIDTILARDLGVVSLEGAPVVFVDGVAYAITGVYDAPDGRANLTGAVVVPPTPCFTGEDGWEPAYAFVRTRIGAADKVAATVATALHPEDPDVIAVSKPADLGEFRRGVENDMQALLIGLAAVSLVIGAVSVSNTALVSVMERRSEIGLRRAIGASRGAVAAQFVWESALIGVIGGLIGTVIGVNVTAFVALLRDWQLVLDPLLAAAGPVTGAVVGIIAGVHPAWRASRVPPAVALRS